MNYYQILADDEVRMGRLPAVRVGLQRAQAHLEGRPLGVSRLLKQLLSEVKKSGWVRSQIRVRLVGFEAKSGHVSRKIAKKIFSIYCYKRIPMNLLFVGRFQEIR